MRLWVRFFEGETSISNVPYKPHRQFYSEPISNNRMPNYFSQVLQKEWLHVTYFMNIPLSYRLFCSEEKSLKLFCFARFPSSLIDFGRSSRLIIIQFFLARAAFVHKFLFTSHKASDCDMSETLTTFLATTQAMVYLVCTMICFHIARHLLLPSFGWLHSQWAFAQKMCLWIAEMTTPFFMLPFIIPHILSVSGRKKN